MPLILTDYYLLFFLSLYCELISNKYNLWLFYYWVFCSGDFACTLLQRLKWLRALVLQQKQSLIISVSGFTVSDEPNAARTPSHARHVQPPVVHQRMRHGRGSRSAGKWHRARGADTAYCLRHPQDGVRHGDGAMRRPPSPIPSATDRAPPESRATPSAGDRVQRTVERSVRRSRDGRLRGLGATRPARQPAEHRLRNQEATAKRQKVFMTFFRNLSIVACQPLTFVCSNLSVR